MAGTIYLIHFTRKYHHAQHYVGYTTNLAERISDHRQGQGARLLEVLAMQAIAWEVVATWSGTRKDERRLKNRKHTSRFCPRCLGYTRPRREVLKK